MNSASIKLGLASARTTRKKNLQMRQRARQPDCETNPDGLLGSKFQTRDDGQKLVTGVWDPGLEYNKKFAYKKGRAF